MYVWRVFLAAYARFLFNDNFRSIILQGGESNTVNIKWTQSSDKSDFCSIWVNRIGGIHALRRTLYYFKEWGYILVYLY